MINLSSQRSILFSILIVTIAFTSFACTAAVDSEQGDVPDQFSWADIDGVSYIGPVKNQNFPSACNSGWAFSTISMLESRIKRVRSANSPDISLSTQVLLSCDTLDFGCLGGDPQNALRWIRRNNITDQTCQAYKARGYTQGQNCTSQTKCQKCFTKNCVAQQNSKIYSVSLHGTVASETAMMQEIHRYGPIACGVSVTNQLKSNYTEGIFQDATRSKGTNHFVMVYGWGIKDDVKYWRVRNSWGSAWGQNGDFRIVRGTNNLGIENSCYWSALTNTWDEDVRNKTLPFSTQQQMTNPTKIEGQISSKINYPMPPFLTSSKSVLTPKHCQASWGFSVVQMLRDRAYLRSKGKYELDFSVQSLLNCGLSPSCSKQIDPFEVLAFIHKYGIPQEGCQNYAAEKPEASSCSGFQNCATCKGTAFKYNCNQVNKFKRWKVLDFGAISGEKEMKEQINKWGPIVCGIDKSSTVFVNYKGGIIEELTVNPKISHYVEVVGQGQTNGERYWIARNFWGTAWGEQGFFRIKMGGKNLGIERRCLWANIAL